MARTTKAALEAQVAALNAQVADLQAQLVAAQQQLAQTRYAMDEALDTIAAQRVAPAPQRQAPVAPNWQLERLAAMAQAKELAMRFGRSVKVGA